MRYYLICDNTDTCTGLRLCGIEGVVVHTENEVRSELEKAMQDKSIGVLLISEKLASLCRETVNDIKLYGHGVLITEIPDRHGTLRPQDSITGLIRDAIGIKL